MTRTSLTHALPEPTGVLRTERRRELANGSFQLGLALCLSTTAGYAVARTGDWEIAAAALAGLALLAVGLLRPAAFVAVLLLARPLVDGIGGSRIADVQSANVAGALGVVLIVVAAVAVTRRHASPALAATGAFAGLLAVSAVAAGTAYLEVGTVMGLEPVNELIRIAALLAVYLLAARIVQSAADARRLFAVVALSAVIPAAVGIYQWLEGVAPAEGFALGRITGTFVGPLPFSSFLAIAGVILICLPHGELDRRLRWPALAIISIALVGTYSREGWILFLLALALLHWRRRKRVILAVAALCVLIVALVPSVQGRVLPAAHTSDGRNALESLNWRMGTWEDLLQKYSERPLTGWGLKSTVYVNPRAPIAGVGREGGGYEAHNAAVRSLVEGGPLLLIAYAGLFIVLLVRLRTLARRQGWPLAAHARILMSLWAAVAVIALGTDDPTEATAMMYALLALTASIEAAHRLWLREQSRPPQPLPQPGSA